MTFRDILAREFLGNPLAAWAAAAGILAGVFAALVVVRRLLVRRLERTAPASSTMADDVFLDGLRRTRKSFLFALALVAASLALEIPESRRTLIEKLATVVALVQLASWGTGAIAFWLLRMTRERQASDRASLTTLNVIAVVARVVLWALLFLLALQSFGVDVTALITGLGIAGVAVALAVQNVLGDVLASLSIALDKPFVIGDYIVVDAFQGTVEEIGLKTTRIRSLTGEQIIVANAELLKARIRNYQRQTERRVAFTLLFPLETPPDAIERVPPLVRETILENSPVRLDRVHFAAITDQALAVEAVYFVLDANHAVHVEIQQRINLALLRRLSAAGVRLAVPTRSVVVKGGPDAETEATAAAVA
ncbi:mechanosensitive ion channel family protein [Roseisolibacter sp. H3M3-2]|uniref:mechanosensitive ion channel family protein n=1 Tax=Roseisolibacter sp. H3M3-2 TaxID=3031323 RepID=UPI0023DC3495|nr:mechanosensitive ion channel family protein [Roseisolibacter sp. H3M3-2]MDF1505544.1 mechanosensitive ion channel family protein [Roseisolibacter sp. H3M3-2]